MKVIFLDFDGVVNGCSPLGMGLKLPIPYTDNSVGYEYFSVDKLKILYDFLNLCCKFDYKIVISSTWRMNRNKDIFNEFFKSIFNIRPNGKYFTQDLVVGCTEVNGKDRGLQILDYLKQHTEITDYLVIDDNLKDIIPYIPINNILEIQETQHGWWEEDIDEILAHFENTPKIIKDLLIKYDFVFDETTQNWIRVFKSDDLEIKLTRHNGFDKHYFPMSVASLEFNTEANWLDTLDTESEYMDFESILPTLPTLKLPQEFNNIDFINFRNELKDLEEKYSYETNDFTSMRGQKQNDK